MKFISTRGHGPSLDFGRALVAGLAPDGGLYVPEKFPRFNLKDFSKTPSFIEMAQVILSKFMDDSDLKKQIPTICQNAFDFPIPVRKIDSSTSMLELFHGPTAAFKDVGARFLAECLSHSDNTKMRTIIVATSGDTGGAVAGAFHGRSNAEVFILYPKDMVSDFQERQLTCWGENVHAFKVRGTFDDCQNVVKEALLSPQWKSKNLISANSINIGRILPQALYYAWSALNHFNKTGTKPGFIIPSGNLGNSLAALWAKEMGFPVEKVILAFNANKTVVNYFDTGQWTPAPSISTLANAMDVGNPSNMERLRSLYPDLMGLKKVVGVFSVTDDQIEDTITEKQNSLGLTLCPHTATAFYSREQLKTGDWIIVATAHAAKFSSIVEPLISKKISFPKNLEKFKDCKGLSQEIEGSLQALMAALNN